MSNANKDTTTITEITDTGRYKLSNKCPILRNNNQFFENWDTQLKKTSFIDLDILKYVQSSKSQLLYTNFAKIRSGFEISIIG